MIKISHGLKEKAEYIPYQGTREEAEIFEREVRGLADRSDPFFSDLLPDFFTAYKNRSSPKSLESVQYSFRHLSAFFGGYKLRHLPIHLSSNTRRRGSPPESRNGR